MERPAAPPGEKKRSFTKTLDSAWMDIADAPDPGGDEDPTTMEVRTPAASEDDLLNLRLEGHTNPPAPAGAAAELDPSQDGPQRRHGAPRTLSNMPSRPSRAADMLRTLVDEPRLQADPASADHGRTLVDGARPVIVPPEGAEREGPPQRPRAPLRPGQTLPESRAGSGAQGQRPGAPTAPGTSASQSAPTAPGTAASTSTVPGFAKSPFKPKAQPATKAQVLAAAKAKANGTAMPGEEEEREPNTNRMFLDDAAPKDSPNEAPDSRLRTMIDDPQFPRKSPVYIAPRSKRSPQRLAVLLVVAAFVGAATVALSYLNRRRPHIPNTEITIEEPGADGDRATPPGWNGAAPPLGAKGARPATAGAQGAPAGAKAAPAGVQAAPAGVHAAPPPAGAATGAAALPAGGAPAAPPAAE